jgi:hypothetical protein
MKVMKAAAKRTLNTVDAGNHALESTHRPETMQGCCEQPRISQCQVAEDHS